MTHFSIPFIDYICPSPPKIPRIGDKSTFKILQPSKSVKRNLTESSTPPSKKTKKTDSLYPEKLPSFEEKGPRYQQVLKQFQIQIEKYVTPAGEEKHLTSQYYLQKSSCGGGVEMMIALDILGKKETTIELSEEFKYHYMAAKMLNADAMILGLEKLHIQGKAKVYTSLNDGLSSKLYGNSKIIEIDPENKSSILEDIKKTIQETGNSVILGITHKILDGHWVIVDQIEKDSVYIRDPYTARAYKVMQENFLPDLLKDVASEFSVYFPKQ